MAAEGVERVWSDPSAEAPKEDPHEDNTIPIWAIMVWVLGLAVPGEAETLT